MNNKQECQIRVNTTLEHCADQQSENYKDLQHVQARLGELILKLSGKSTPVATCGGVGQPDQPPALLYGLLDDLRSEGGLVGAILADIERLEEML